MQNRHQTLRANIRRMTLVFAMAGAASALGAPPVIYDLGTFFHGSESHATGVSRDGTWVTGYGNVAWFFHERSQGNTAMSAIEYSAPPR